MKGIRIIGDTKMATKDLRTSTVLDRSVLDKIKTSMGNQDYGPRQRSKWVNEALVKLSKNLNECDDSERAVTLSRAAIMSENGAHITVVLKPESVSFIEDCKKFMASREADFEKNAQSRLIHFAVTFRLMREKYL